ncbi:hypothetical protein RND81_14G254700 [Saponaria officinalis]|uniref:Uncharacterized protein n=1 Tax=Saponaria officinalis TaxID=3572 RepID=A0AAW1GUK2_SAPOF
MGICNSQLSKKNGNFVCWRSTVMIVQLDGTLVEYDRPITAGNVLSDCPSLFLASSESMYVDFAVPAIPYDDELEVGQIYFVLPISQIHKALSLQDLCGLAIKASIALGLTNVKRSDSNVAKLVAQARSSCRGLTGFDALGALYPQAWRASRRVELKTSNF